MWLVLRKGHLVKTLEDIRVLQEAINKRARTRLRRRHRNPPKPTCTPSRPEQMGLASEPAIGVVGTEWACPGTNAKPFPHPCSSAVAGVRSAFSPDDRARALGNYELFHQLPNGCSVIKQVLGSSAGIQGFFDCDSDTLVRVGNDVIPQLPLLPGGEESLQCGCRSSRVGENRADRRQRGLGDSRAT